MKFSLLILLTLLCFVSTKAQNVPQYGFDTYPKFTANSGNFNNYIAQYVQNYLSPTSDIKTSVSFYISIDTAGKASVESIYPNTASQITDGFNKAIITAPNWVPAKLNGLPVSSNASSSFNVEINRANKTIAIRPFAQARQPETTGDVVYSSVQISPEFVGGQYAYERFVGKNTMYPPSARQKKVSGLVYVQFIVEKDGSLSALSVLRDPGEGLGEEAIRIFCLMPNWTPGIQNGKAVRVQYVASINFTLFQ